MKRPLRRSTPYLRLHAVPWLVAALWIGLLHASTANAAAERDFTRFWTAFRAATLADDREALVAMSRFPFVLHGQLDDDPAQTIDAAVLRESLPDLLLQDTGLAAEEEPMLAYVERLVQPPSPEPGSSSMRVGPFEFTLQRDGWRFAGAYLSQ
jgi:hypothetical protein